MEIALPAAGSRAAASAAPPAAPRRYDDGAVRLFTLAAVLWGVVGMAVGVLIAAQLTWPRAQLRHPLAELRAPAAAAHQRGDLRLRRLRPDGEQPLRRAAHLAGGALPAEARVRSCSGAGRR